MPRLRSDEPAAGWGRPEQDAVTEESVDVSCHGTYALLFPNCVQYFLYAAREMPLSSHRIPFISWTVLTEAGAPRSPSGFRNWFRLAARAGIPFAFVVARIGYT
jgi:hypothetical protein